MPESTRHTTPAGSSKSRLGRGLGSLLGDVSQDVRSAPVSTPVAAKPVAAPAPAAVAPIDEGAQIWQIAVDRLEPNTQQPRQYFSPEGLKELAESIRQKGILQPITARRLSENRFEIIAGERRWRAAQAAGLHEVPVILRKAGEQDSLELAIIENVQRQDLNSMDEAEAYDHLLKDYSLTQQQVAERVGKERATVANALRFLVLPPEVKEMLRRNDLSAGHAKAILAVEGSSEQIHLAKKVISEKLSVRATEKIASQMKKALSAKKSSTQPKDELNLDVSKRLIDGLAQELQKLIGTKVAIDYANSQGKLSMYFYSDDELTNFVEKIRSAWAK